MATTEASNGVNPNLPKVKSGEAARYFYPATSVLLFALMLWGFSQFYLHGKAYPGREIPPPIKTLVILHGISMSLWMLLFLVQPFLIRFKKHRIHMLLGKIGAALAAAVVVVGFRLGVESARLTPPEMLIWGYAPKQFMIVPIVSIVLFAGLVSAGVWFRRKPKVHRPLMLLSVLAALSAAISRIDLLNNLYVGTICERLFGPFFMTLLLAVLLVAVNWALSRSIDRVLAAGTAGLIVVSALMIQAAPTTAWAHVANFLTR